MHPPFGIRGSQYASPLLGKTVRGAGMKPSMGSISPPRDNASMGSLAGPVKAECVHARTLEAGERATPEIFEHVERFYNRIRICSALGSLSPEELEARHAKEAASAA